MSSFFLSILTFIIGDVREVGPIVKAAQEADAVCHLAFIMDFRQFAEAVATEKKLITALHQVMKGTNKPFIGMFYVPLRPSACIPLHSLLCHTLLIFFSYYWNTFDG